MAIFCSLVKYDTLLLFSFKAVCVSENVCLVSYLFLQLDFSLTLYSGDYYVKVFRFKKIRFVHELSLVALIFAWYFEIELWHFLIGWLWVLLDDFVVLSNTFHSVFIWIFIVFCLKFEILKESQYIQIDLEASSQLKPILTSAIQKCNPKTDEINLSKICTKNGFRFNLKPGYNLFHQSLTQLFSHSLSQN